MRAYGQQRHGAIRDGFVRIAADQIVVEGNVQALSVKVAGRPKLVVNGKPVEGKLTNNVLSYEVQ